MEKLDDRFENHRSFWVLCSRKQLRVLPSALSTSMEPALYLHARRLQVASLFCLAFRHSENNPCHSALLLGNVNSIPACKGSAKGVQHRMPACQGHQQTVGFGLCQSLGKKMPGCSHSKIMWCSQSSLRTCFLS